MPNINNSAILNVGKYVKTTQRNPFVERLPKKFKAN